MRLNPSAFGAAFALCVLALTSGPSAPDPHLPAGGGLPVPSADSNAGAEWIGRPAPQWSFDRWIRTRPLSLTRLHGKVVLLRWWTEECPYCAATLPALEQLSGDDA